MNQTLLKQCVAEFIGPLIGGALAGLVYGRFLIKSDPQ